MGEIASPGALCTLERVLSLLDERPSGDDEAAIVRHIDAVSARFEQACGRRFRSNQYVRDGSALPLLAPLGPQILVLPNPPITAISSLKVHPNSTALTQTTTGTDGSFDVDAETGVVTLFNGATFTWFPRKTVAVTYTGGFLDSGAAAKTREWGWDEAGADIQLAVAQQVAHELREARTGRQGLRSMSVDGVTVTIDERAWIARAKEVIGRRSLANVQLASGW